MNKNQIATIIRLRANSLEKSVDMGLITESQYEEHIFECEFFAQRFAHELNLTDKQRLNFFDLCGLAERDLI